MRRKRRPRRPTLRFSPYAWAKLLFLRDVGDTEVGGFGISHGDDLLLIEDVRLVRQDCSPASVEFDDAAVADFFDEQVDQGRKPEQFGRVWLHTHPGNSAGPSGVDEETFTRCFGKADWAVMFILAQGGACTARLRFSVGPCGNMEIPVDVDFDRPFPAADRAAWEQEYRQSVVRTVSEWQEPLEAEPEFWTWGLADEEIRFPTWLEKPAEHPEEAVPEESP